MTEANINLPVVVVIRECAEIRMEIEEKYQLAVEEAHKAYNDSEGNLEYAVIKALEYFEYSQPPTNPTSKAE